ncbi:hypothetical protein [Pectinatus frisingensis]|uniref:hypothetical protein n=1 Tax=Pectinatus frisingensis TaxID=865 RepID=UPI0018C67553|nr:hypothetical protein [Pectinatus frisingensis]
MMHVVMNFLYGDIEYMVYEAVDYMPGSASMELLCSRKYGIGADRMLIFTDAHTEPSFRVFTAAGEEVAAVEQDFLVFAYYLRQQNVPGNAAEIVRVLGDQTLIKVKNIEKDLSTIEIHLTDNFCEKMRKLDKKNSNLAC